MRLWRVNVHTSLAESEKLPVWNYNDRRWTRMHVAFAMVFAGLLAYSLLAWQQMFGLDLPWHPVRSIALNASLLLQSIANIARTRSLSFFWILLALSLVVLVLGLASHG